MHGFHRRTTPRVKQGKVQRKNRSAPTPNCFNTPRSQPLIERRKSGCGYRHLLRQADIERFLGLLPDWPELSRGLNAILLAAGERNCCGWHQPGIVAICAWERDLWTETCPEWHEEHRVILDMIGVPYEVIDSETVLLQWSKPTIRAFQLTHILLHELGHHHDRMTTRSQRESCRGEAYAERYALRYSRLIWNRYLQEFGQP